MVKLYVKELTCYNCFENIAKQLNKHNIFDIDVDLADKTIVIEDQNLPFSGNELITLLKKIGFSAKVVD